MLGYFLELCSLELHPLEAALVATVPAVQLRIHKWATPLTDLAIRPAHPLAFEEGSVADVQANCGDLGGSDADPSGDEES